MQRRNFVRAVSSVGALGIIGSQSASASETATAEEIGVVEDLQKLFQENKLDEVKKLLEKNNIKYDMGQTTIGSDGQVVSPDNNDSDGVSTEGYWQESSSSFSVTVLERTEDDRWLLNANGTLSNRQTSLRDAAVVNDALGLFYDTNEWTVDPSYDIYTYASTQMTAEEFDLGKGLAASVSLPRYSDEEVTMNAQYTLEKTGTSTSAPVSLEYDHTWAYASVDPAISISISIPTPIGSLDIDLTDASTAWSLPPTLASPDI